MVLIIALNRNPYLQISSNANCFVSNLENVSKKFLSLNN